jgi:hypothetical protein
MFMQDRWTCRGIATVSRVHVVVDFVVLFKYRIAPPSKKAFFNHSLLRASASRAHFPISLICSSY